METNSIPLVITTEPIPLETDADGIVRVGATRVTLDTVVAVSKTAPLPKKSSFSTHL